ncbi:MAG: hypothetical protein HOE75_01515 [Chloroflexi bacterium]|nr:hypothetical protein [Chloroflexota bacterium]
MTIYRRLTFVVADMNVGEDAELLPAVLTTMGAVETPFIGGTGIMLIDVDETPLSLSEIEVPVPLAAQVEVLEFPETFSSAKDNDSDPFA